MKRILTYCCMNCRTRYIVEIFGLQEIIYYLRCPNCGLAEVNPEETPLSDYIIKDGELVKK